MIRLLLAALTVLPFQPLDVTRLPDMSTPRADHALFSPDGETLVVVGGHTTGFVPTDVAEIFSGGRWTASRSIYQHDAPFLVKRADGNYLTGGGYSNYLGVGQSVVIETFDTAKDRFLPEKILSRKRARATAIELSTGDILISGNWYAEDLTEIWNDKDGTVRTIPVSQQRSDPYILRTGGDDALIFSSLDIHGEQLRPILVDRLSGGSFSLPLLDSLRPLPLYCEMRTGDNHAGTAESGLPIYLVAAQNESGQAHIIKVEGESFCPLPLPSPLPAEGPWGRIYWHGGVYASPQEQFGLLVGRDADARVYLFCLDWAQGWDAIGEAIYVSDPLPDLGYGPKLLLDGRRLLVTGGIYGEFNNNYNPLASVWMLTIPSQDPAASLSEQHHGWKWLLLLVLVAAATACSLLVWAKRRKTPAPEDAVEESASVETPVTDARLYKQIVTLMEDQQLFRRKNLKMSDVASALGTNTRYVSAAINAQGYSFVEFVNGYRVQYAMELFRRGCRIIADVADESGFTSEVSFFRNFKKITGMTPSQWCQAKHETTPDSRGRQSRQ